jgi:hypothetical protein
VLERHIVHRLKRRWTAPRRSRRSSTPASGIRRSRGTAPGGWRQSIEWHAGELFTWVGFVVTNLSRRPKRAVEFYNGRGMAERWIKGGRTP